MAIDLGILCDTELNDRAVEAATRAVREQMLVKRSQIAGLFQIAAADPQNVSSFASHQRERAEKRKNASGESQFWGLVQGLCEKGEWNLEARIDELLPRPIKPKGQVPPEMREQRQREKAEYERLKASYDRDIGELRRKIYGAFFQHFCAHYSYARPASDEKDNR